MSMADFSNLLGAFLNEVWFELSLVATCTAVYRELWINYLYLLNSQPLRLSSVLYQQQLLTWSLFLTFLSHLECYMTSMEDALIFLKVLRNNIKIPSDSHSTSQINLNMNGHYQVIPVYLSCGIVSCLWFCH